MNRWKEVEEEWDGLNDPEPVEADPAYSEWKASSTIEPTADLLGNLLHVPKEEADHVHRGHN